MEEVAVAQTKGGLLGSRSRRHFEKRYHFEIYWHEAYGEQPHRLGVVQLTEREMVMVFLAPEGAPGQAGQVVADCPPVGNPGNGLKNGAVRDVEWVTSLA